MNVKCLSIASLLISLSILGCDSSNKLDGFVLSDNDINYVISFLPAGFLNEGNIHFMLMEEMNNSSGIFQIIVSDEIGEMDSNLVGLTQYDKRNVFLYGSAFLTSNVPKNLVSKKASTIHWIPDLNSFNLLIKRRGGEMITIGLEYFPPRNLTPIYLPDDIY